MKRAADDEAAEAIEGARPPRRRRSLALLIGGSVLALLLLVGIIVSNSISLGAAAARSDLEARLSALTGEPVFVDGTSSFDLFPQPLITLSRVRIGLADPSREYRVDVDYVQAELDLFDALIGRPVIDELTLIRPEAVPAPSTEAIPSSAKSLPAGATGDAAEPATQAVEEEGEYGALQAVARTLFERFEGVRTLRIRDGVFRPESGEGGVSSANLDFSWPGRTEAARLIGNYVWNGQPAKIDATLAAPRALYAGERSEIRFSFSSPSLSGSFTGFARLTETPEVTGSLRLGTPSLARTVRWLGRSQTQIPEFGAFELATELHLIGPRVFLGEVRLDVGGYVGNGAMEAVLLPDGRPAISGTLAFETLELDRLARAVAPLPRHALDLQRPIAVAFVNALDLDLRLSASEAVFASLPARQLAATIKFVDGVATLDIGDAEFLGGRAAARLTVDTREARPTAKARVALDEAEAAELAALLGIDTVSIAGRSALTASFSGPVSSWADILRRNQVEAKLRIEDGRLAGLDPATFLEVGERPLATEDGGEPLPFRRLEAELSTSGPRARFKVIRILTERGEIEVAGTMSLLSDRVDLAGVFRPQPAQQAEAGLPAFTPSQPSRFTIAGEWPLATVTVDAGVEPI